jgi:hypothetical protein
VYIFSVYWILSFSDPGRVPDHEKLHLTNRFTRLHKELILQQREIEATIDIDDPSPVYKMIRQPLFEDSYDALIFNNYFAPDSVINYKMKDGRELKYCKKCKCYKMPRMHHCSACNSCCMKYDHHCGMVMNCIGVNNYHIFLQFMLLTFVYFSFGLYLNVKYNFYIDFKYETSYMLRNSIVCGGTALMQGGSGWYAYSMLTWYFKMASKNMHAIE